MAISMKHVLAAFSVCLLIPSVLRAENAVTVGAVVVERPTLICLGFEWDIQGDDNRNATVAVSYRPSGSPAWKEGMPLLRMGGERIFRAPYVVPHRFAGSPTLLAAHAEQASVRQYTTSCGNEAFKRSMPLGVTPVCQM